MLQKGMYARFKNPNADELTPGTGRSIIMKVLEVDAPRALVEFCTHALIRPTARVSLDALQRVFSAHPHIDIPDFLNTDEYTDESYGNDVTAHMIVKLPEDADFEIWVYVHPNDPAERESADYHKYEIVIYDRATGDESDVNQELEIYSADDPELALACIEHAKDCIMLLVGNKRNREADEKKELIKAILSIDPNQYEDGDLYHDACEALGWETDWEFFENELETATLDDLREMEAQVTIMTATAEDDEE